MRSIVIGFSLIIGLLCECCAEDSIGKKSSTYAGPTETGYLLPNGWHITPVGKHVLTTDLPLNIIPLRDNVRAIITTNGFNPHQLSVIDFQSGTIESSRTVHQSWFGLAIDPSESKLWWSGGGGGLIHTFDRTASQLIPTSEATSLALPAEKKTDASGSGKPSVRTSFKSGLWFDASEQTLISLDINLGTVSTKRIEGTGETTAEIGGRPYDIAKGKNGLIYVSDWANRRILVLSQPELQVVAKITVGEHPNQIVLHPNDDRLFVACASSNGVWVVDTSRGIVTEIISTSLFPRAPEGSTPDALAISPDGDTLFVSNADNNCVAVVDISSPNESIVRGFIPTGWYPTAVAVTPDGKNLLVGVGKGNQSAANPIVSNPPRTDGETESRRGIPFAFIGTGMTGALSVVAMPDEAQLKEYTAMVYRNCPYSDSLLTSAPHPNPSPIPTRVGDPSPIKYVIYVIKENRTYDQVFGDLAEGPTPKGKGDPALCMFPRKVTPNHHKIAEEFVLLDNLYCNGQVSKDGHPWSTMAYNTDYIARDWHLTYSARRGVEDDEEGNLSNGPSGYLWDACNRAGISYRSYGEYGRRVSDGAGSYKMEGRVPGLMGHMSPRYGIPKAADRTNRDTDNAEAFIEEYDTFVRSGQMPRFIIMSLGEDHTHGTRPGAYTPQACVASNDLALGRIVDHISHSPLWKETAIFVIEDDAQNGPDHVDAHRTVGFVISPYTKRQYVDSTQYSTVSLIRTMELILGLPPLSQYDAAARPMFASFSEQLDTTPYVHVPAQIDVQATNDALAYGADRSQQMDFSEYDQIDDFELNEILWHSIMGKDAPLPPAMRRAIAFRVTK